MIRAMLRRHGWILIALALFAAWQWWPGARPVSPADDATATAPASPGLPREQATPSYDNDSQALPAQARQTLRRILDGGPHPYRQDGGVFHNRERLLPPRPRGWYREYTVDTPGSRDRGARRIVAGGDPPAEFWYTADHYRSFRRIQPDGEAAR